jgi:predicted amidophosphoribosyltransferase
MMDMLRATSGVSSVLRKVSRAAFDTALDTVLPPQCLACDALVSAPFYNACGVPFEFDHGPDALCGSCTRECPVFERVRAVFLYNDVSRDLITGLKHRDRMHGAPAFGRWLARAGADLVADADWIAPVPLHPLRLWRRRFN